MAWPGDVTERMERESPDEFTRPLRVLMVCTGNICRSPLAEQLLTAGARRLALPLVVSSAGTHAMLGGEIPEEILKILVASSITPTKHLPRQLTVAHLSDSDVVLTATREHRKFVVALEPRSARYVFTMKQFTRLIEGHRQLLAAGEVPAPRSPRHLIRELADVRGLVLPAERPEDDDIADPFRKSEAAYELAGAELSASTESVLRAFLELSP